MYVKVLLVAVVADLCQSASLKAIHDLRETKETLFNRTMTSIAGGATTLTDNMGAIVNHTAIKLMSAKHNLHDALEDHASKLASSRAYSEKRWSEWRNKTAEHFQPVKEMFETMQDAVLTKVIANVDLMHRKGEIMSDFFKTVFGSVVDMVYKTKANVMNSKKESKDAVTVHASKVASTPVAYKIEAGNQIAGYLVPILYAN